MTEQVVVENTTAESSVKVEDNFVLGRGLIIAVEGIDCSGKGVVCKMLQEELSDIRLPVKVVSAFDSTATGRSVRAMFLNPELTDETKPSPTAELLAVFAARADAIDKHINPAMGTEPNVNNAIVIADRYNDSSLVYQVMGKGADLNIYNCLSTSVTDIFARPLLTLFVNGKPEECHERAKAKEGKDLHESKSLQWFNEMNEAYRVIRSTSPFNYLVIDNTGSLDDLRINVRKAAQSLIKFFMQTSGYVPKAFFDYIIDRDMKTMQEKMASEGNALQAAVDAATTNTDSAVEPSAEPGDYDGDKLVARGLSSILNSIDEAPFNESVEPQDKSPKVTYADGYATSDQ